jgi:hypothetical protein
MKFSMLICGPDNPSNAPQSDPAAAEAGMKEIYAWFEKWGQAGKIADAGVELDSVSKAKTIRAGADGAPVVTDGPYLELKEVVGGFVVLEADDIDDAVAVASTWPAGAGTSIEIRPIIDHS